MNLLYHNIVKYGQQTLATWAYSSGELRMRITIRSDSSDFQSYARAEMWDARGMQWNPVASVHFAEMKTPPGMYAQNSWSNESAYKADHDELLRRAALIVHGWDGRDGTALLGGWRLTVGPLGGDGHNLFIWREGRVGSLNVRAEAEGFAVSIWDSDAANECASCSAPYAELDSYGQLSGNGVDKK